MTSSALNILDSNRYPAVKDALFAKRGPNRIPSIAFGGPFGLGVLKVLLEALLLFSNNLN